MKKIGKSDQRLQIRLNIVVFILVDGLLADLHHVRQLFLTDAVAYTQHP